MTVKVAAYGRDGDFNNICLSSSAGERPRKSGEHFGVLFRESALGDVGKKESDFSFFRRA